MPLLSTQLFTMVTILLHCRLNVEIEVWPLVNMRRYVYSGPSILRPAMGPCSCGLLMQVVLK